ncbi:hypothetical protein GCM10008935_02160 [Alkalibacillus silvisoli]|uniref:DUF4181 domain-containing protein n=2 Tax=Alkalibacillus silvisoli TaxID=392823 RepID=A0ABN0ZKS0_9BACI
MEPVSIVYIILVFLFSLLLLQYLIRKCLGVEANANAILNSKEKCINQTHGRVSKGVAIISLSLFAIYHFAFPNPLLLAVAALTIVWYRVVDIVMHWIYRREEKVHIIMVINSVVIVGFVFLFLEVISL